jgi:hypothetical protein
MENNTLAYVKWLSEKMGVSPDSKITLNKENLQRLLFYIFQYENGKAYISQAQIKDVIEKHNVV